MDRLSAIAAFVAAVDEGSLAAAARRLKLSTASVSRAVSALEDRLGSTLLHRTPRALRLTDAGGAFYETCHQVVDLLDRAERDAAAKRDTPNGELTLQAPFVIGSVLLRPVLDDFLRQQPNVTGRLVLLLERARSVLPDGVDLALRTGDLPDSTLVATTVGALRWVVCAAPAYLAEHGAPADPLALLQHRCISAIDSAGGEHWRFRTSGQLTRTINLRPRLTVSGQLSAIDSALEGRGIARVMSFSVHRHLSAGTLVSLLPAFAPPPSPVHVVTSRAALKMSRVRGFVDVALPRLRDALAKAGGPP